MGGAAIPVVTNVVGGEGQLLPFPVTPFGVHLAVELGEVTHGVMDPAGLRWPYVNGCEEPKVEAHVVAEDPVGAAEELP